MKNKQKGAKGETEELTKEFEDCGVGACISFIGCLGLLIIGIVIIEISKFKRRANRVGVM